MPSYLPHREPAAPRRKKNLTKETSGRSAKLPRSREEGCRCRKTRPKSSNFSLWTRSRCNLRFCFLAGVGARRPRSRPRHAEVTSPLPEASSSSQGWSFPAARTPGQHQPHRTWISRDGTRSDAPSPAGQERSLLFSSAPDSLHEGSLIRREGSLIRLLSELAGTKTFRSKLLPAPLLRPSREAVCTGRCHKRDGLYNRSPLTFLKRKIFPQPRGSSDTQSPWSHPAQ